MHYDVVVIGAGAAGLMCAAEAGKNGRSVLLLEHCDKVGKKILISGGGRCNFTNLNPTPSSYYSNNKHFCKSALSRYSEQDFIELVKKHKIEFYEKKLGQLFCRDSARQIVEMLVNECAKSGVEIRTSCTVNTVSKNKSYTITTNQGEFDATSLVIATGGLSIPKMGATDFGHQIAKQFNIALTETRAGLVPFIFDKGYLKNFKELSGISVDAEVSCNNQTFRENILITHKGISGPAILQISSYWQKNDPVTINLLPDTDLTSQIEEQRSLNGNIEIKTMLSGLLPKRLVQQIFSIWLLNKPLKQLTHKEIDDISNFFHQWTIFPSGTEGYRTAEVTIGGVDVNEISSKTFESKNNPGLFFIGEVLDVTGWLGGYNFQWAWASAYCAGQHV
jgi:hypothetical protein